MSKNNEEEIEMTVAESIKHEKAKSNSQKRKSKIPFLNVVNGKVQINDKDPLQKKWFEEFKK
ncbi:hypothetical protein MPH47_12180 [Psychrobacillus psychrodurans]|uniref:hypothetical protein n=1 Tax=Psychrobacillus psychrodurans TaxID=126157 RepID=UPI001F4D9B77|nr:hypothetical protein [Psychrobacillus psychrodurans]MCK1997973.1 hypothetical protein [Psychrobacillus psychrodurans]